MKKIYIITAMVFLLNSLGIVPVSADDADWTVNYAGDFADESKRGDFYSEISNAYVFEGNKALTTRCYISKKTDSNYIEVKGYLSEPVTDGEYTLKYYAKLGGKTAEPEIYVGDTQITDFSVSAAEAPSGDSNWKEYSKTFTYSGEPADSIKFIYYYRVETYSVDNISLTAAGSDENLILNPGFETGNQEPDHEPEPEPEPEPDPEPGVDYEIIETDYQPKVMQLSTAGGNAFNLNWRNPASDKLIGVKVYNITDGKEKLLTDSISTVPSKIIYYTVDGLAPGTDYQFKIVFSFDGEEDGIYFLGGATASYTEIYKKGSWQISRLMMGAAGYCPADLYIDNTVSHSGESSIKFVSNINTAVPALSGNIYLKLDQTMNLEEGKTYKISYYVKGKNVKKGPGIHMSWKAFNGEGLNLGGHEGTYDWRQKTYTYTYNGSSTLVMLIDGMCEGIWFDDVEFYEVDKNGNKIGDNLIADGGFENLLTTENASVSDLSAEPGIGNVNLKFDIPEENYTGSNLYLKTEKGYEYRGRLADNVKELNISGLSEGREYTFALAPLNSDEVEGDFSEVTVETLYRDSVIEKPFLRKDGKIITELDGGGEYTISVSAKNNALENPLEFEVIAVLYDGEDEMKKIFSAKNSLSETEPSADYEVSNIKITVPDGEGYYIGVYVVESRSNLQLVYKPIFY